MTTSGAPDSAASDTDLPFHGLVVVEFGTGLASSYCGKLLADAGARVTKVEPPGGDPMRRRSASGHPVDRDEVGALFQYLNSAKRLVGSDAAESARDLGEGAVVICGNGPPRELSFCERAVVHVTISPFGCEGPWAGRPANEFTLQAWCGSLASRGRPEGPPIATGGEIGEWATGAFAAVGALVAWRRARNSSKRERVDVSMFEVMALTSLSYPTVFESFARATGTRAAVFYPRSIEIPSAEPTRDGYVGLNVLTGTQLETLLMLIGRSDLAGEDWVTSAASRFARRDEFEPIVRSWTSERSVDEVVDIASALRLPVAPVANGETLPTIEHFRSRGVFVQNPRGGFLEPRRPYRLSRGPRCDDASVANGDVAPDGGDAELPLAGLRVLDFTAFWAGPFVTEYLASMGADVVKVESVQRPDGIRFNSVKTPGDDRWWEWSPVFHGANANKRSVTLNLNCDEGLSLARQLVATSDVIVENFSPRVMEQFGLTYESIASINPGAIMVRMPAFGLEGPWSDFVAFASTVEHVSGMTWRTGLAEDAPVSPRGVGDTVAGLHALIGTLCALEDRDRTGCGQLVEACMAEALLGVTAEQVVEFSAYGRLLGRIGNRAFDAAPQNVYRCRGDDEWVAVSVTTDDQWEALRRALGRPEWAEDPALERLTGRIERHDAIDEELSRWCGAHERDHVVEVLWSAGVPVGAVVSARRIEQNEHLVQRGFFEMQNHDVVGKHAFPGLPIRSEAGPFRARRTPAPQLGEHNEEVLTGRLGVSVEEVAGLADRGVIGTRPVGA